MTRASKNRALWFMVVLALLLTRVIYGQAEEASDTSAIDTLSQAVPNDSSTDSADATLDSTAMLPALVDTVIVIPRLDFSGTSLYDALTALARAYNLSLYIDSSVTGSISIRLDNVLLNDALRFIIRQYGLAWEKTGSIIKIYREEIPPIPPPPLNISYSNGLLSAELSEADLGRLVDTLIDVTGRNIILEGRVRGRITGKITSLAFEKALEVLLSANGFSYRKVDQVIYVGASTVEASQGQRITNLYVSCENELITVEASNVRLADVISRVGSACNVSLLVQTQLEGNVTAQFENKTVEEALSYLLMNSNYTFKESSGLFFLGNRDSEDLFDSRLLELEFLIAETVLALVPPSISKNLTIKVVKEHNALLATGSRTSIVGLQDFVKTIDIPTAQVLFEVLVVDYTTTDRAEFRLTANDFGADSGLPGQIYWPRWDVSASGTDANDALRSIERHLDLPNLGVLDDNFFIRLEMLEQEGKANVQSHPQIATMNGHSASIQIGTTQYYLLETETVYPSQQTSLSTQTSERFEKIEADMKLVVTPYVSRGGDLIVQVNPEFSTPVGTFNPVIPPTVNKRILESTIRLRNGETIVLGGLVQTTKSATIDKVPILGSIPIIGRLFQNRSSEDIRSELMIYVTPYVYFGSEGTVNRDSIIIHHD